MVAYLLEQGHDVTVVTSPPYYPQWKVAQGYSGWRYQEDTVHPSDANSEIDSQPTELDNEAAFSVRSTEANATRYQANLRHQPSAAETKSRNLDQASAGTNSDAPLQKGTLRVIRCPLWVPGKVTGLKRIIHLASFGLSSVPVMLWNSVSFRPDVVMTVEPAAMCMPTTWIAAQLCRAKTWLHVQDFEVDAAFELGILKQPMLRKLVLGIEGFLMRRFDRVSSISPNMLYKLVQKGVDEQSVASFPNWVDCEAIRPLDSASSLRNSFGIPHGKCVCLYSGNIGAKQGLEILVEAAQKLAKNKDIHFVICGDGANRERLQASAKELSNMQWLPLQPFERLNELLNCADIHMLPQRSDAADLVMPSKLTGMLASGRPVVACAHPGTQIADVVEDLGAVVPPGDAKALADAIEVFAGNCELREHTGASAREYAVNHLSREAILSCFTRELEQLAGISHDGTTLNGEKEVIAHAPEHKQPDRTWRFYAITAWVVVAITLAAFFLLRPDPSASNVTWLPQRFAAILDRYPDGRTFLMTAGITLPICVLLHSKAQSALRRLLLTTTVTILLVMEIAQSVIPSRSFSLIDLSYTLLAGALAEAVVLSLNLYRCTSINRCSDQSLSP